MEIDLAHIERKTVALDNLRRAGICIIGAGIAGLTLAHKLIQLGHDVLLLEAGGNAPAAAKETSSEVLQAGDPHPGTSKDSVRALGGTSLTWGGQLLPLPLDSGWPVTAAELAGYTEEAERLLRVDDLPYDAPAFFTRLQERVPAVLQSDAQLAGAVSKFTPFANRNLAQTLAPMLRNHAKARLVLHAHATELLLTPNRDRIEAALVRTPAGRELRIEAAQFVVAAGTVDTVRLLLASRSVAREGIGNEHDQVGRNFHDHLTVTAATFYGSARSGALKALRPWITGSTVHSLKLAASAGLRARLDLPPIMAHLTIVEPQTSGIGALRGLLRAHQQNRLAEALRSTLPQLPRALYDAAHLGWSARRLGRRYVSPHANVFLRINAAQSTPSASRITLLPEQDHGGQRKALLEWRIDRAELVALRRFTAHVKEVFEGAFPNGAEWNAALLDPQLDVSIPELDDARHAMGGVCMGVHPRTSVVTPELCVHGIHNLFIASAATFPDGSPQLPSLPLMALVLRLADHLHRQP